LNLFCARPVEFRDADPPKAGFHRASAYNFVFEFLKGGDSLGRFHSPDPGFLLHLVRVRSG